MKSSRFKFGYRDNASQLHIAVGNALRHPSSPFSSFKIYQEYPVNKINTDYYTGRHHFDWVVKDLMLIIECHGEQHYKPTDWSNDKEKAKENLEEINYRDNIKMKAAIDAGYTYIIVPYNDIKKVSYEYLWKLYLSQRR